MEGMGGLKTKLGAAPMVTIGDGEALGELAGGRFIPRPTALAS